ncbi:MAG: hypothetical protein CL928_12430 [Deltaproteobacteria bacterium]|nr:hypothetical protein [Deltaproteobacteria bacterium]
MQTLKHLLQPLVALALGAGLFCSAMVPSTADAQIIARSAEVDLFGGYYFFRPSNWENLNDGPIIGGRLGINIMEHLAVEATAGYVPTSTQDSGRVTHYVAPHFDLVIHTTAWRVVPYFAVGAGFQWRHITEAEAPGVELDDNRLRRDPYASEARVALGDELYAIKDTDFIFDVGGGIKFLIFERGGLRLDSRYLLSIGPGEGDGQEQYGVPFWVTDTATGEQQVDYRDKHHHVELTAAAFFLFGGGPGKDSDGDGLPDREDECENEPEDKDEFQDEDGCPDRDNDRDGINDLEDNCPMNAEDRDGWRDSDGCPDPDNDGDGLRDGEDGCPSASEDMDGYQDTDGCPDPDNDSDGIPDSRDGCPLEAEDKDSFRDDDGCPEPDNDGDGIADVADACPNAAEELNGIEDEDGCPEQDSDGDGVYDGRDQCTGEAEDLDGHKDEDGCPDPDNDGDGIVDVQDQCPMVVEDVDGWEDGDGCPDFDNDEDGIPDETDQCPNKTEDDDGFDDKDGCPDYDNDQDGLVDGGDRCPNHPETINGFEDTDGCPDEIPERLRRFTGVIPDIQFKRDSETLLSTSYPTLNRAAQVLADYSEVRMEIQGHASSEGDDDYNMELSQRRAEAVRTYMISRGVDASRLIAKGYGETVPAATNRNEAGRSANRRVEFQLIQD